MEKMKRNNFDRHEHANMIYLTQNSFNPVTHSNEISGMGTQAFEKQKCANKISKHGDVT